jgi:hypothetical protein
VVLKYLKTKNWEFMAYFILASAHAVLKTHTPAGPMTMGVAGGVGVGNAVGAVPDATTAITDPAGMSGVCPLALRLVLSSCSRGTYNNILCFWSSGYVWMKVKA